MTDNSEKIIDLERRAVDAERAADKSPFMGDRKRFAEIAAQYRADAAKLKN